MQGIISLPMSVAQVLLAATMIVSTIGSYFACTPPNPPAETIPETGDFLHSHGRKSTMILILTPAGILALHTILLAFFYPKIPSFVYGYGAENGLNPRLITWSTTTAAALAVNICVRVPLRLVSYAALGKNFTFALAKPDRLVTEGIYRYVQHPGYAAVPFLTISNIMLFCRPDGAVTCFVPPRWYRTVRNLWSWVLVPGFFSLLLYSVKRRVSEEESMLRGSKFGPSWEEWHAKTARFIPGVFWVEEMTIRLMYGWYGIVAGMIEA